jgi:4'-phosphopantetheinyl transferase EntD
VIVGRPWPDVTLALLRLPGPDADRRAGRLAARSAAAELLGLPANQLRVERRPGAPPRLRHRDGGRPLPLRLSVAHRDGLGVAAATAGAWRIGVDVERHGAVRPAHARLFLTRAERRRMPHDLATAWALKEAAWKALRLDARTPFAALDLRLDARGALRAVRARGREHAARARLRVVRGGHVLALVRVAAEAS